MGKLAEIGETLRSGSEVNKPTHHSFESMVTLLPKLPNTSKDLDITFIVTKGRVIALEIGLGDKMVCIVCPHSKERSPYIFSHSNFEPNTYRKDSPSKKDVQKSIIWLMFD